jgi:hypothetical protein
MLISFSSFFDLSILTYVYMCNVNLFPVSYGLCIYCQALVIKAVVHVICLNVKWKNLICLNT